MFAAPLLLRAVILVIDFGGGDRKEMAIEWRRGMTVLDGLRRAEEKSPGIRVEVTHHKLGVFVEEIDGVRNDMLEYPNQCWVFHVNGVAATVGCDAYRIKPDDVISWTYSFLEDWKTK